MLSPSTIAGLALQAAVDALRGGKKPFPIEKGDGERFRRKGKFDGIPDLGDYRPAGYELLETLLCDSTGMGSSDEPAYTVSQLCDWITKNEGTGLSLGIIETGQFQVVLGVFRRNSVERGNKAKLKGLACPDCGHTWESHSKEYGCSPYEGLGSDCDCKKYKGGNGRVYDAEITFSKMSARQLKELAEAYEHGLNNGSLSPSDIYNGAAAAEELKKRRSRRRNPNQPQLF